MDVIFKIYLKKNCNGIFDNIWNFTLAPGKGILCHNNSLYFLIHFSWYGNDDSCITVSLLFFLSVYLFLFFHLIYTFIFLCMEMMTGRVYQ